MLVTIMNVYMYMYTYTNVVVKKLIRRVQSGREKTDSREIEERH